MCCAAPGPQPTGVPCHDLGIKTVQGRRSPPLFRRSLLSKPRLIEAALPIGAVLFGVESFWCPFSCQAPSGMQAVQPFVVICLGTPPNPFEPHHHEGHASHDPRRCPFQEMLMLRAVAQATPCPSEWGFLGWRRRTACACRRPIGDVTCSFWGSLGQGSHWTACGVAWP